MAAFPMRLKESGVLGGAGTRQDVACAESGVFAASGTGETSSSPTLFLQHDHIYTDSHCITVAVTSRRT